MSSATMPASRWADPFGTVKDKDWDWILDVNLKGVVYGVETFTPLISSHGEGGHFVNTASMAGMISPAGNGALHRNQIRRRRDE